MAINKKQKTPLYARKTTQLPKAMREELESLGKMSKKPFSSRKDKRKQDRQATKERKAAHFSRTTQEAPLPPPAKSPAVDAPKTAEPSSNLPKKRKQPVKTPSKDISDTPLSRLLNKSSSAPKSKKRKIGADPEDETIAWLEAQLGGEADGEFEEDGLGDLISSLNKFEAGQSMATGSDDEPVDYDLLSGDDNDSTLLQEDTEASELPENDSDSFEGFESEEADLDDDLDEASQIDKEVPVSDDESIAEPSASNESKYIPPHLREKASVSSKASIKANQPPPIDPKLRRQILGLLNRLSATTIGNLLPSIEEIFLKNSRALASHAVISILLDTVISQGDVLGETQLVVFAGLVSILGRLGGTTGGKDFVAGVIAAIIDRYDGNTSAGAVRSGGKEKLNLVAFVSALYKYHVVACTLLYDFIQELINKLDEESVELLLRIIKSAGLQLRHDDPAALKQIIQLVNEASLKMGQDTQSSRHRYMIETLTNLKNNKLKASEGASAEAEALLKTFITSLGKKRSLTTPEPLRLNLSDIRDSASKGKWWIVGAAWGGNPLAEASTDATVRQKLQAGRASESNKDNALEQLARKQGMNTDIRRAIFVVLMGSEDYVDACDRLLGLGLSEIQQREIVRVILHCTGQEKSYNPFYILVLQRLISNSSSQASHSFAITLQYALWDYLRSLGEKEVGGAEMVSKAKEFDSDEKQDKRKLANLGKAWGWLIAKGASNLGVLKPLDFAVLQPQTKTFLSQLLTSMLIATQSSSPLLLEPGKRKDSKALEAVIMKIAQNQDLCKGLRWYLKQMKVESERVQELVDEARETLKIATSFGERY